MEAKIPYGLRQGRLLHVSQLSHAEGGKRCECVCPECGTPLLAKMGDVLRHHFAHAASGREVHCQYGAETGIHLAAKQLIHDRLEIPVPRLVAALEGADRQGQAVIVSDTVFEGVSRQRVDEAKLEFGLGDVRPDLMVTLRGYPILIEVAVTHFIDLEKRRRLESRGQRCIEIDLSKVPRHITPEELEAHVYDHSLASWIVNPKLEAERDKLKPRLQERIDNINQDLLRRLDAHLQAAKEKQEFLEHIREQNRLDDELRQQSADQEQERQRLAREKQAREDRERHEADMAARKRNEELRERLAVLDWERERSQLDLDGLRRQAREVHDACIRIEQYFKTAPAPGRFFRRMARQSTEHKRYQMDLDPVPQALSASIYYDWMFGVPPLEWKLVAFLETLYLKNNRDPDWVTVTAIENCLRQFGYGPIPALGRAADIIATARHYQVLEDAEEIAQLCQLPRPEEAIIEFLGQLASDGIVDFQYENTVGLICKIEPRSRWR